MPWVVGIDEAGYGPNLGPLVQTGVAVRLPDDDPAGWTAYAGSVHRAGEKPAGRVLIDDSKKVHQGANPLGKLERGLAAILGPLTGPFADWLAPFALPGVLDDLRGEAWFDPQMPLPIVSAKQSAAIDMTARIVGAKLVPAPLFNQVTEASGSKATVLGIGLGELLAAADRLLPAGEPIVAIVDKQGGRNHYAHLLQGAFPDGWVVTEHEAAAESRYRVANLSREFRVEFRPRADGGSLSVAVASMLAKYLREVCMRQFNAFWAGHVPGLPPTAGYPVDAKRYYAAIGPAMATLGISSAAVWRIK